LRDIDSRFLLTIEEELDRLEENIRRLKIEYESFFAGGSPRPPRDTVFRVETAMKKGHQRAPCRGRTCEAGLCPAPSG